MAGYLIVIVGGASFDSTIKDFFGNHNLCIEHYNARKSSDLKKQTVPKNTIGVIVTVDRSHMVFGNSNELTRYLYSNKIPFVFSSGNNATFNAAKILFQKIKNQYPDLIKEKETISDYGQKLDYHKQEWSKYNNIFMNTLEGWFKVLNNWENYIRQWNNILEDWKLHILEWKDIQNLEKYKEIKKKINKQSFHLVEIKDYLHSHGINVEKNINTLKNWKSSIEESSNDILEQQSKLQKLINKIDSLENKIIRVEFKEWRTDFEKWKENIELWEKEYKDWEYVYPETFKSIEAWQTAIENWQKSYKKVL